MSVSAPALVKGALQKSIADAFDHAKKSGSAPGANSDAIIQTLAKEIADAIDTYSTSLQVTVKVFPGQTVATSGGAGSTTTSGTGQG
jgi:hypothetical protein